MPGETDLGRLLANLSPGLQPEQYVFCCLENPDPGVFLRLQPLASFRESEGITLVITRTQADSKQLAYDSVLRCISLGACSSLDAVGLTAAVASALAAVDISANVIAAYHHDHIFVPADKAQQAMAVLESLSESAAQPQ